jgi:Ca2+/H+ antiporter
MAWLQFHDWHIIHLDRESARYPLTFSGLTVYGGQEAYVVTLSKQLKRIQNRINKQGNTQAPSTSTASAQASAQERSQASGVCISQPHRQPPPPSPNHPSFPHPPSIHAPSDTPSAAVLLVSAAVLLVSTVCMSVLRDAGGKEQGDLYI